MSQPPLKKTLHASAGKSIISLAELNVYKFILALSPGVTKAP